MSIISSNQAGKLHRRVVEYESGTTNALTAMRTNWWTSVFGSNERTCKSHDGYAAARWRKKLYGNFSFLAALFVIECIVPAVVMTPRLDLNSRVFWHNRQKVF